MDIARFRFGEAQAIVKVLYLMKPKLKRRRGEAQAIVPVLYLMKPKRQW